MGMVSIDVLETGMLLASDVHDRTGRLLLGAGTVLTMKHLVIFRTWGVREADVAGTNDCEAPLQLPPDVTMDDLLTAEKELEPFFRHAGLDHPAVQELLRLSATRKVHNEYR